MLATRAPYQPKRSALVRFPTFSARLADACRLIRRSAPRLTESDSQLVSDFERGRGTTRIERLANIASLCSDPADATALGDCFRGHALARMKTSNVTVLEALRLEAQADGGEDAAMLEYLSNPCEANRQRAIEALRRAVETSQAVIDALHRLGPA